MINYILQVILFQVLFLAIYDFFLGKETFFNKNRSYLLTTPLLSFLIPLIKIPTFKKAVPQEYIIHLPEIVLSPEKVIEKTEMYQSVNQVNYLNILFWIGVVVFSILFLAKLFKVVNLIRKHQVVKNEFFKLVLIPEQTKAFSFFNFIFLGKEIPVSQQKQIIAHELVHTKQKHSLDLLFFEILKIVMWFNPMIYFYQKRITLIHEYISDEVAAKSVTKEMYINNLLSNFFQVENIAFVNQFYKKTLIKKRIIMMKKTQSKKTKQLKYLVLIPVLASMLFYTSCASIAKENKSEIVVLKTQNQELLDSLSSINKRLDATTKLVSSVKSNIDANDRSTSKLIEIVLENEEATSSGEDISFTEIEKAPTFPDCEEGDKKCFSRSVQMHFGKNFNADLVQSLGLPFGKKRVFITFKIDKEGNVADVKARGPHKSIEEEVIRVISTLPKMIPGEQKGEKVSVKYSIPFTLYVDDVK
ncbi:M56 family metallopeptidase [Polaribacter sargassicola]|uniref:M56 family metallopeptidase n=1 Tax=Polaribacter sargassicola TaxID=2836891 RepID=UPI001F2AFF31|nr:M56 family metallopeptidase [Polaribacter sp. DS7-9]MCG1035863.1 M56 family metallopeptidase [Polaribacter sp. DS7-9]